MRQSSYNWRQLCTLCLRFFYKVRDPFYEFKIYQKSALIIILITPPGHKFARVTTAWLSWNVQNCDMTE